MSGTSAQITRSTGITLPAPHMVLAPVVGDAALAALNPSGNDISYTPSGVKLRFLRSPLITVMDVPEEAFEHDLRVELLWFRKERLRSHGGGGNGYRHPTHGLSGDANHNSPTGLHLESAVLPASRFRGGSQSIANNFRVSEWSPTHVGQRFFFDNIAQYFEPLAIQYIDMTGTSQPFTVACPTFRAACGRSPNANGFGYASEYRPNYFRFRYSIQDPSDSRNRLVGPETPTVFAAHAVHPFVQDAAATTAFGFTCHKIAATWVFEDMSCWIGTRVPTKI